MNIDTPISEIDRTYSAYLPSVHRAAAMQERIRLHRVCDGAKSRALHGFAAPCNDALKPRLHHPGRHLDNVVVEKPEARIASARPGQGAGERSGAVGAGARLDRQVNLSTTPTARGSGARSRPMAGN